VKIKKTTGSLGHERLTIKAFKTSQEGHQFLNKQHDNTWNEYSGDLKSGVYAFAGGAWHNVKHLDKNLLNHI
jgi:hypothetical protein